MKGQRFRRLEREPPRDRVDVREPRLEPLRAFVVFVFVFRFGPPRRFVPDVVELARLEERLAEERFFERVELEARFFFPPPSCLFTVAQAARSAVAEERPERS